MVPLRLCLLSSLGGNPLVPHVGMADTNVHFFDGAFRIFATHGAPFLRHRLPRPAALSHAAFSGR